MLGSRSSIEGVGAAASISRINSPKIFSNTSLLKRWGASLRVAGLALPFIMGGSDAAMAQSAQDGTTTGIQPWAAAASAQALRVPSASGVSSQPTPAVIPAFDVDSDPSGLVATDQPSGDTITSSNAFFQDLGTNGRTCFTCHQPQTGWTISAAAAQARFDASDGLEPLFRLVDGATCPSDDVSTTMARRQAYSLLLSKGLIRIFLPLPPPSAPVLEFEVHVMNDPYNCTTNPAFGLTSPTTGFVSVYRRPLPSTNLGFLSTIMFDGREPNLFSQATDATLVHAQGTKPNSDQLNQIVEFELGIFTAQFWDYQAHYLNAAGADGGPVALSQQPFYIGINDPFGLNPTGAPFNNNIFDLYDAWENLAGRDGTTLDRESVARGQKVFNTKPINITNVAGINDVIGKPLSGFCGTCHDTPNVGDHSVKAPLNIGIADSNPPALNNSGLPVFTLLCTSGSLAGHHFVTTDPGRALISGKCADIGKFKGPILRSLAARAPYFHNGSAATLMDAVNFYDQRFGIGFTEQEKQDLVNFLNSL